MFQRARDSASLHLRVQMSTSEFNAEGDGKMDWQWTRGVETFLVSSCYRNWDKLWPDGPIGSFAD